MNKFLTSKAPFGKYEAFVLFFEIFGGLLLFILSGGELQGIWALIYFFGSAFLVVGLMVKVENWENPPQRTNQKSEKK